MSDRAGGPWETGGRSPSFRREHGFSLIELMIAMLILGVVLSAMASALIKFSGTTVTNERRVQATAFLTEQHEQLQSIPWERAFIYADDAPDLAPLSIDMVPDPPLVDSEPLVVEEGPDLTGCDFTDPATDPDCGRLTFVPKAQETVQVDGRDYEVFRAITWDDTVGDGRALKRFTTLVRWEARGKLVEQRFESTRAGTASELGDKDLPEVLSLVVSPGTVQLDDTGRNLTEVTVRITFERGITSAELAYPAVESGSPVVRKVAMSPTDYDDDSKPFAFDGVIPADSDTFLVGDQDLIVTGKDGVDSVVASRTVAFIESTGGTAPEVTSVTVSLGNVEVGTNGSDEGRLCQTLTVRARAYYVEGGVVPGTLTANYVAGTATGASMTAPPTITGSNDEFVLTFADGTVSPWEPTAATYSGNSGNLKDAAVDITDRFDVIAENPDGSASSIVTSPAVVFTAKTSNGGRC